MRVIEETFIHEAGTNGKVVVQDCCAECISLLVDIHREDYGARMKISRAEAAALRDALNKYLIVN